MSALRSFRVVSEDLRTETYNTSTAISKDSPKLEQQTNRRAEYGAGTQSLLSRFPSYTPEPGVLRYGPDHALRRVNNLD